MRMIDADALINSTDKEFVHKWEIALAPTIEAEPIKHGRWIKNGEVMMFGDIPVKCSQCGFKTLQDVLHKMDYHYCPICGAKMDEVEK